MAMRSNIKMDGEDAIKKKLIAFLSEVDGVSAEILNEAADMLVAEAKARAPVSKGGSKYGKYQHPPGTLRDSIAIGNIRKTRKGISMAVGIAANKTFTQEGNQYYARWVEFGTSERFVENYLGHKGVRVSAGVMPAQPFMRPAAIKARPKIRAMAASKMKEELFDGKQN